MYTYENIGAMDKMCPVAQMAGLGTVIDTLVADVVDNKKYTGSLLTAGQTSALNKMCSGSEKVQLGTLINNILTASKNGTTVAVVSDTTKNIINNMCMCVTFANLGGVLQSCVTSINEHGALSDDALITAFTVPNQTGDSVIDAEAHTIAINMPVSSDVSALIATFTLSDGATAKVGTVAQASDTTPNDFTSPVVYTITSESGDVTIDWTVTITVAIA
jgi:hypothetical protein